MLYGVIPVADIRYTKSGNVSLAYQVFGAGDTDLVLAPGYISNLEANWEEPNYARFLERLASRFRVVVFDKRDAQLPSSCFEGGGIAPGAATDNDQ